jgi:hypothetical protein
MFEAVIITVEASCLSFPLESCLIIAFTNSGGEDPGAGMGGKAPLTKPACLSTNPSNHPPETSAR